MSAAIESEKAPAAGPTATHEKSDSSLNTAAHEGSVDPKNPYSTSGKRAMLLVIFSLAQVSSQS
jgi:hypothetical protein